MAQATACRKRQHGASRDYRKKCSAWFHCFDPISCDGDDDADGSGSGPFLRSIRHRRRPASDWAGMLPVVLKRSVLDLGSIVEGPLFSRMTGSNGAGTGPLGRLRQCGKIVVLRRASARFGE